MHACAYAFFRCALCLVLVVAGRVPLRKTSKMFCAARRPLAGGLPNPEGVRQRHAAAQLSDKTLSEAATLIESAISLST